MYIVMGGATYVYGIVRVCVFYMCFGMPNIFFIWLILLFGLTNEYICAKYCWQTYLFCFGFFFDKLYIYLI